jgi:hypothetical protein
VGHQPMKNVPQPQQVVSEMVALARPGGVVVSHEVDWGASICDPPPRGTDCWRSLRLTPGATRLICSLEVKTHQMFRNAGLMSVQVTPVIHAYPLGNSQRNILCDLLESVRDRLVVRGLITDIEYKEELSLLGRHLADTGTLVIPNLHFQVWGKKPE